MFVGSRNVENHEEAIAEFLKRLTTAAIDGAFLIGPTLIMVRHKTLLTTLLNSSICVFAFGVILAFSLEAPFDVFSSTAAYAEVLVVFIRASV